MKNKNIIINSFRNKTFIWALAAVAVVVLVKLWANQFFSAFIYAFLDSNKGLLSLAGWGRRAKQLKFT